jgi:hypothetical protein
MVGYGCREGGAQRDGTVVCSVDLPHMMTVMCMMMRDPIDRLGFVVGWTSLCLKLNPDAN